MIRFSSWFERLPLWLRTLVIVVLGWTLTVVGLIADANDTTRRMSLLVFLGPVLTIMAIIAAVGEERAVTRRANEMQSLSDADAPEETAGRPDTET